MAYARNRLIGLVAGVAALGLVFAGGVTGLAQDATPEATPGAAVAAHPGHIHSGTCDNLGDVVVPLPDVPEPGTAAGAAGTPAASPMASPAAMGAASAILAAAVSTTVDLAMSDILGSEHAINYHESAENIQNYIACGAIGGTPDADGNLFIGLEEQNGSGYFGIAWLQDQGDSTTVTVFLASRNASGGGGAVGTPEM